jgi:hypothetical protein
MPVGIALLAGLLAVGLRLPFLGDGAYADEGGLLVVAAHWRTGGPFLYGPFFVDRPPLLLAFFRLADSAGGLVGLRVLGLGLVLAAVACAARAGARLGGSRGMACGALVCGALLADPRLGTREIDAETVGVPLVLLAAMLTLEAARAPSARSRTTLLVTAGVAGASALLVKQNLADGLVFAVVLVLSTGVGVRARSGRVGWLALGATIPAVVALLWSTASTGAPGLWYSLYGFRLAASSALFGTTTASQSVRLQDLGRAALVSGLAVVVVIALVVLVRRRRDAVSLALVAMLLTELVGVAGGGYYWPHYLIGLVPGTALLLARAAPAVRRGWVLGVLVTAVVGSSVWATASQAMRASPVDRTEAGALDAWMDRSAQPHSSAVVLYGGAATLEASGLRPAYPYLWTLPQRVLDPHLTRLVHTLDGPRRPTYVIVRMPLDSWGQDPHGRVRRALASHYRRVARVDGDRVYAERAPKPRRHVTGAARTPPFRRPAVRHRRRRTATGSTRRHS